MSLFQNFKTISDNFPIPEKQQMKQNDKQRYNSFDSVSNEDTNQVRVAGLAESAENSRMEDQLEDEEKTMKIINIQIAW